MAIVLDVTQRKEVENRLNLVIEGAELGFWDWDYVTGKHQVNDRCLDMLGLSSGDLDDYVADWSNRIYPDDKKHVLETIEQSIKSHKPYTVEFRMRHTKPKGSDSKPKGSDSIKTRTKGVRLDQNQEFNEFSSRGQPA